MEVMIRMKNQKLFPIGAKDQKLNKSIDSIKDTQIEYLISENKLLRKELTEHIEEIEKLKKENMELKKKIRKNRNMMENEMKEIVSNSEEQTFLTKGSILPCVKCENCGNEIEKEKYKLHILYCLKNIVKCPHCHEALDVKVVDKHNESKKGTMTEFIQAIKDQNEDLINSMILHGFDLHFKNPDDNDNTCVHYAAQIQNLKMLNNLIIRGCDINETNKFGETALHQICRSPQTKIEFLREVLSLGGNPKIKNKLGESPDMIAQRSGNHEFVIAVLQENYGWEKKKFDDSKFYVILAIWLYS